MCEFYAPLKACDEHLRFVFLTGITKFSQLSICSELNNLSNISLESDYAGICGITEDELHSRQAPDVAKFAEALGVGAEEAFGRLKDSYDGCPFVRVRRTSATPSAWSPLSPGGGVSMVLSIPRGNLGMPRRARRGGRSPIWS